MFPTYAGGNNQFNTDGTGEMGDAFALAARIDYAAAANLNLWGSYMRAQACEKNGYYAGTFGKPASHRPTLSSGYQLAQHAASPGRRRSFQGAIRRRLAPT